jgi:uncharacterized protein (DUF1501 family)
MDRRRFLSTAGVLAGSVGDPFSLASRQSSSIDTLVLVELDGGNDGLNTVIPIADARYRALRPTLSIHPDDTLKLDARTGLHPSLRPLMPAWHAGQLAIVQGTGFPGGDRSHFRSRQIWHSASDADEYRDGSWLDRVNVLELSQGTAFVASCKAAANAIVARHAQAFRLVLHGFDTHENQARRHAMLLGQLAQGLATLQTVLTRTGHWDRTLVLTVSEFGRSARENDSGGTEHGAASAHFVLGGRVHGGIHGAPPRLEIDTPEVTTDFRRLYATAIAACSLTSNLNKHVEPLPILRA